MKNRNIQSLIYRNYLKSSLVPIFVIEIALLLLYFGINFYISDRNRSTMLAEATQNIKEIASREVTAINRQLMEVHDLAVIMQRDHESFFERPGACYLPNASPEFGVHGNGAFYKLNNNGGGSLYYASTTKIGKQERQKARCSEMLDPLLVSIVETSPIVTQAYLNTWDDMNRLYPFMPDAPGQYGTAINMEDYNFYYDADAEHNPERKPVWTGAYLDPAGQGWMVSLIVPVYRSDFLEGVSGLDVTISSFVQNILDLRFPWDAGIFMVDDGGTILAMQEKVEQILKLQELGGHVYSESIQTTIEKPEEFNLLNNPDASLTEQFSSLFASRAHIGSIVIGEVEYLVSQEIVEETGWRMMTLVEKNTVFAPITELKKLSNKIGLSAILAMVFFYVLFFIYLLGSSKKLTHVIATPIMRLSDLTRDLGKHLKSERLDLTGIDEVDTLAGNFNTMSRELNTAMNETRAARQEADSVISNFLDSLLVVDSRMLITRVNKETCFLLGYMEAELLGRPVGDLFDEAQEIVTASFNFPYQEATRSSSELRNVELTFVTADGGKLPVSINLARVNNEAGETVGVVAGAKDISELKRTLRKAEQQRQFIQNIFNTVPGGLLVIDETFRLLQYNETFKRIIPDWSVKYGLSEETLQEELLASLARELPKNPSGEITIPGTVEEMIVEYHASSEDFSDREVHRVIFIHDVTSRHKAQAVRKLQSTVLEQTSEGVLVTDIQGVILYTNLAAQHMSGYGADEALGRKPSLFKSGIHDNDFYNDLWSTLKADKVWSGSMTNRRSDGTFFETEMTISPVRSTGKEVTHYVSLWRDVGQIRSLQRQLLQAQKLEAVGQLAAGVAHEINTPIQYIQNNLTFFNTSFTDMTPLLDELQRGLGDAGLQIDPKWRQKLTELIEESDLNFLQDEIPQGIEEALKGVETVARIVAAMKEFANPGKEDKQFIDINRHIENAVLVTHGEWKDVAELTTEMTPNVPLLSCESSSMSQLLLHLILNARDAVKARDRQDPPGRITISTRSSEDILEITIKDNGVGIAADVRDRIFDPFFTTKEVGKGSGQGLAIVYDIVVNRHKGEIVCESEPGMGTTMIVRLPVNNTE